MSDALQGRARDPDATIMLPTVQPDQHPYLQPPPPPANSIGYGVDPSAITMEQPIIRDPDDDGSSDVARHGAVMAVGSIVSRVTGFVRTAAIGAAIGAAAVGNDYNLANTLPGMVYELLLGGVLASVVVPLLVRARTRDADRGEAYTQRLLSLAAIFLAGATVVAVVCAPLFTAAAPQQFDRRATDQHLITHALVPAAPADLLLRDGCAVRGGAQHPRSLRDADVGADPEQHRRDRGGRHLRGAARSAAADRRR